MHSGAWGLFTLHCAFHQDAVLSGSRCFDGYNGVTGFRHFKSLRVKGDHLVPRMGEGNVLSRGPNGPRIAGQL